MSTTHIPVLYQEVLAALRPRPHTRFIDGTLGGGGHTEGLLAAADEVHVLAFDRDPEAIQFVQARLSGYGDRLVLVNQNFAAMGKVAPEKGFGQVEGILLDLGLSSRQLDTAERGFSFRFEAPLDMRFDPSQGESAADLLNNWNEADLADIIWRYGEERQSRKIAQAIVRARPITTTGQLAELVAGLIKRPKGRSMIHPATQIFQALRIAVNDELGSLARGLAGAIDLLQPGGRLAVISFHSLEDRIVKQLMRDRSATTIATPDDPYRAHQPIIPTLRLVTPKPITASTAEMAQNPRSRSAKLRVAEKL
ncbi:MAG: 16S rRNA (cytosine(1402)-N(4))-methyltransferase RsmH [Chloroflexi bacterium]|nr:16S rRNA (cytosine(1402)-N(4))-methyltransferase RsmH [Chloroflexota bacterium]MBP8054879.1 16S rRNA (cytosine(1402)-N(4))-methyltransferase RsmH [Chloroflexota bacterium]